MKVSSLIRDVESLREEIAKLSSELVRIPTPNPPGDTERCVTFIEKYFDENGIPTRVYSRTEGKANIVARIEGHDPVTLLWLGHIDVVPEGNLGSWNQEPYGGDIRDGFIYGRGSSDMKGTCAAAMVAAKTIHKAGKPPKSVEFWFTCDEETQGEDGARWLAQEGIIKGDVCVIGDSSGSTPTRPYIDVGCKGMIWTQIRAEGRTAHGSTPYLGQNAIEKLLRIAPNIKEISTHRLEVPQGLKRVLRSSIDFLLSTGTLTAEQRRAAKRMYNYPTVALNTLNGGVKINVVPDTAEAGFDIRLTPGVDFERMKNQILRLIEKAGVEGITTDFKIGTGYYENPQSIFAKQLMKAVKMVTSSRPALKVLTGGTDAIFLKNILGIPCLGFGASLEGQAHAPDEHVSVENLVMAAKVFVVFPLIYKP